MTMTKTTRTKTREVTDSSTACDLCGKPSGDSEAACARPYGISEAKIRVEEGSSYPEGSDADAIVFDCCAACFKTRVVPMLLELGFKLREERISW